MNIYNCFECKKPIDEVKDSYRTFEVHRNPSLGRIPFIVNRYVHEDCMPLMDKYRELRSAATHKNVLLRRFIDLSDVRELNYIETLELIASYAIKGRLMIKGANDE